ncbi:DUF4124 domain-containing protein [Massilia sp. YIM B02443]|uniref:DUF4124 domain-containing protein n=1 Tax=Massilia sp. YIM B02443 TaxID=3050127 RepID=UPI0025B64840|nr:DUF4124 domain-containing protein [Massilia sp. YIM B02443]MDN4039879.1 DUF4124 domain-containing protein [Massilia sp. YIM B02443]
MRILFLFIACVLCQAASAGTIYKCRDGERVSYSDQPCAGAGSTLAVPDAPPPDPATQERLERQRATVLQLEKGRLTQATRDEREFERAQRTSLAERKRCDRLRLQRQWADEDLARQRLAGNDPARAAAGEAARLKARRQADTLALECPA